MEAAERYGFCMAMLRWLLTTYSMPRMTQVMGAATNPVRATRTIVPGCSFADLCMRLALLAPLCNIEMGWPRTDFAVVADDVQALFVGEEEELTRVGKTYPTR